MDEHSAKVLSQRGRPRKNPTIFPPDPGVLAQEIVEDLEPVLEQFREIADD
jgi:hypothetical protein